MTTSVECELGDVVEIEAAGPTPFPPGLTSGFQVRLIRIEPDHRIVERDGREWRLRADQIRPRLRVRCAPGSPRPSLAVCPVSVIASRSDHTRLRT